VEGPQTSEVELEFAVPSLCADRVGAGLADVGLVPVYEMDRMGLGRLPGLGICSRGQVRTILLISKVSPGRIQRLATDTGSRTSVQLARIILRERHGATPELIPAEPVLKSMLAEADAALVIGDAALAIDPEKCGFPCFDLGEQWTELTGLPMVYAVWAGRQESLTPSLEASLEGSARYGLANMERIVAVESKRRGFSPALVEQYLTRQIQYLMGREEEKGMEQFLIMAKALNAMKVQVGLPGRTGR
jgi:predicted solute-binding protein